MRQTTRGLQPGQPVRVTGAGRFACGTISGHDAPEGFVAYHAYYNGGLRYAPLAKVHAAKVLRRVAV